jgi:hypothetical protein
MPSEIRPWNVDTLLLYIPRMSVLEPANVTNYDTQIKVKWYIYEYLVSHAFFVYGLTAL